MYVSRRSINTIHINQNIFRSLSLQKKVSSFAMCAIESHGKNIKNSGKTTLRNLGVGRVKSDEYLISKRLMGHKLGVFHNGLAGFGFLINRPSLAHNEPPYHATELHQKGDMIFWNNRFENILSFFSWMLGAFSN